MPSAFIRRIKRNRDPVLETEKHRLASEIIRLEEQSKTLRRRRGLVEPESSEQYDSVDFQEVSPSEFS